MFLLGDNKDENFGCFYILFPINYLKELLIPETNKLIKHPMGPG